MGLDMYLYKKLYLSDFISSHKKIKTEIEKMGLTEFPIKELVFEVGYWRKANQIHKWFVDNVQDGEDDCKEYSLQFEQLLELKKLCEEVLADHSKAQELLPISSGFFFGGSEYDEYYFEQLEDTIKIINKLGKEETMNAIDKNSDGGIWDSYSYSSSW